MKVHHDREERRFTTPLDGAQARIDYEETSTGAWDLKHTWVPVEHREQGIAGRLVRRVLERADEEGREVVPTCPFVASFIDENPSFERLVAEESATDRRRPARLGGRTRERNPQKEYRERNMP